MIPHKTARGAAALERLKAFEGVPAPYDKVRCGAARRERQRAACFDHAGRRCTSRPPLAAGRPHPTPPAWRSTGTRPRCPLTCPALSCTAAAQVKRMVIPDALKVLRLQHGHRYCQLGALASSIGWKHEAAVKELEAKRKVKVRRRVERLVCVQLGLMLCCSVGRRGAS